MEFLATAAFGLEGVVKRECQQLGLEAKAEQGCVRFSGEWEDAFRANLWLRCADRVQLLLAEKEVHTFEELFQLVKSVKWEDLLPQDARIPVSGKCVKSILMSVRDCQSIAKKAIVERLKRAYRKETLPETGADYHVDIAIHKDLCRVTLNTSGEALNKRGYRTWNGEAPLRETLAAALVLQSPWRKENALHDPTCGTGTLLIEAAFIQSDRAPGLRRTFAMESWRAVDQKPLRALREEAEKRFDPEKIHDLSGSDIDPEALKLCKKHIVQAGLGGRITVFQKDLKELELTPALPVCLLCNPPYGERMSDRKACEALYRELNKLRTRTPDSRLCVITAYIGFEKCIGRRATYKKRLYNGRLECDYLVY